MPSRLPYLIPRLIALLGLVLGVVVLGAMSAVFPIGFMSRVIIGLMAVITIFIFAATGGATTTGWERRLGFAFLLLVTALLVVWPRYLFFSLGAGPKVNLLTLSLFGILTYTLGALIRWVEIRQTFRMNAHLCRPFLIALLAFYLLRLFSSVFSEYAVVALFIEFREALFVLAVALSALAFVEGRGQWLLFVKVTLLALFVGAVAGFVELKVGRTLFEGFISVDGGDPQAVNLARIVSQKYRAGDYRIQSTFDHPIVMGQFFSFMFFVAVSSAITMRARWRYFAAVLLPVIIFMIAKSGSRSGIFGLAIGSVMFFLGLLAVRASAKPERSVAELWWVFAVAGASVLILTLLANVLATSVDALLQLDSSSTAARLEFLARGVPAIAESPLIGHGFRMAAMKAGVRGSDGYLTLDNYFLSIALDYGVPTLLAYVAMHAIPVWRARKALATTFDDGVLMLALAVAICVFFVIQSIVSIPANQSIIVLFCIALMQLSGAVTGAGDRGRLRGP